MARFRDYTEWNPRDVEAAQPNAQDPNPADELEHLFGDPNVRQRIGELISRAALHSKKGS